MPNRKPEPWQIAAAKLGARLAHRLRKVALVKGRNYGRRSGEPKPAWYPYQNGDRDDGPAIRASSMYQKLVAAVDRPPILTSDPPRS